MNNIYNMEAYIPKYSTEWLLHSFSIVTPLIVLMALCLISSYFEYKNKKSPEINTVLKIILVVFTIVLLSVPIFKQLTYKKYERIHNAGEYCLDYNFNKSELCKNIEVQFTNGKYTFKYMPSKTQIEQMSDEIKKLRKIRKNKDKEAEHLKQTEIKNKENQISTIPVQKIFKEN